MDQTRIRAALRSVAFTLPTPFTHDGERIDTDALEANIEFLDARGASLYVPCGNTGEYYSLTDDERVSVTETTVDAVSDDHAVLAGAGGSTKQTYDLATRYADAGADAVMVMDPSHVYLHETGIAEYYRTIADRSDLPVVIYKRSETVSDDVLAEVVDHENVVGVKYAVNDVAAFAALASSDADVVWLNGIAERFAPSYALEGAGGFTTGIGNFVPEPVLALQDAIEAEDWERAKRIRDWLRPMETLRQDTGANNAISAANNVPVVKHCMELAGLAGGPVREPLVGLTEADQSRARECYERAGNVPQRRL